MSAAAAHPRGVYVEKTWQHDPTLYAPARYRRACTYESFLLDPLEDLVVSMAGDVAGVVSDAEAAIGHLNRSSERALGPLARLLLRTESIASSRIEGMQVETRTLARAEARYEAGRNIAREAAEILANIDAMQLAVEEAAGRSRLTIDALRDIHVALLANTSQAHMGGQIRTNQNWIGGNDYNPCGADFVPPPPELVMPLLDDFLDFCNDEGLPPLVQAAIAHAQFETIHPFGDGNGRTGRALVHVLLRRRGLATSFVPPISVVLAGRRERYIQGLVSFREGDLMEWLELFASASAQAATLATAYVEDVASLQEEWRHRLRDAAAPRSDAAAWGLIDVLPGYPVFTVSMAVAATDRSKPAVERAVGQLTEAGVLSPVGSGQRNRMWESPELIELLSRLEAGEQPTDRH